VRSALADIRLTSLTRPMPQLAEATS